MSSSSGIGQEPASSTPFCSGLLPSTLIGGILGRENDPQQTSNAGSNITICPNSSLRGGTTQSQNEIRRLPSQHSVETSVHSDTPSVNGESVHTTVVKDITFWGGLCLLICNTAGPGTVTLPLIAQSAGWLPTLIGFVIVGLLSYLSSMFICEAMTEAPGNEQFEENIEFCNLVHSFFSRKYQIFVQAVCFLAMQTTIIASIAICAQVFDNLLIQLFHKTCGIQVHPSAVLICVSKQLPSSSPFSGVMIMTTGALVAMVLIVPLCLMNLSENIWIQVGSCVLILLIFLQWIVTFFQHGLVTSRVPAVGSDMSRTFGSILFNYGFITAVPSLANAKKPEVSIQKTVGTSVTFMTAIFIVISILGAMAYEIPSNSSMIQAITSSPDVTTLSKIAGFTYPIAALVTSIPVNMIVLRYNLIQSGTCNRSWSNILAGGVPWLIAIPGMTGSVLTEAVGWSSLFFVSAATFVIPFILFIFAKKYKDKLNRLEAAESEQGSGQNRVSSMMIISETRSLTDKTDPKGLEGLVFWRRSNSDGSKENCNAEPQIRPKEESSIPFSFMEESEYSGVGASQKGELKRAQTGIKISHTEKTSTYDYAGGASPQRRNGEASSPSRPRIRSLSSQADTIAPPFLSGNNYTIPGFGMCQTRPASLQQAGSELALHLSRPSEIDSITPAAESAGRLDMDLKSWPSRTSGELRLKPAMQAIPRWIHLSSVKIAWGSLALMLIGVIATIIVKAIQLGLGSR
ncbi:hypothetical protein BGX27_011238 [Mortierella sp. AM989]|nr:hypothetical protein BGX27_011238 [Mortierella sp. AM989]